LTEILLAHASSRNVLITSLLEKVCSFISLWLHPKNQKSEGAISSQHGDGPIEWAGSRPISFRQFRIVYFTIIHMDKEISQSRFPYSNKGADFNPFQNGVAERVRIHILTFW
jgi:hypothetical protein